MQRVRRAAYAPADLDLAQGQFGNEWDTLIEFTPTGIVVQYVNRYIFYVILALLLIVVGASAQEGDREAANPAFSQQEIDQMLAPIALYPDALLTQILMAATYPLEVVQAARWSRDHASAKGHDAVDAVADKDWDPRQVSRRVSTGARGHGRKDRVDRPPG